jgi:hypothetical protein
MAGFEARGEPLEPIPGIEAFTSVSASGGASRAAQALGMAAIVSRPDASADLQDDADELGVPQLAAQPELLELYSQPGRLDDITELEIRHYGDSQAELWDGVNRDRSVTTLLALLNVMQNDVSDVAAVAATVSLGALVGTVAQGTAFRGLTSHDELARGVAFAAFEPPPQSPRPAPDVLTRERQLSTTINGTWGLVDDSAWYQPGSAMHDRLRMPLTPNLYEKSDYFGWSGEYSDHARWDAARDLLTWRDARSQSQALDTVYAHSHGGTVALNAAVLGQKIRLLVLLHTPAVPRATHQWAAIRGNIRRVVAMRTRMDLVVLADILKSNSRQKFDAAHLPHSPVVRHWRERDAWFSHGFYVNRANWERLNLLNIVERESSYAAGWSV